jgi:hypothetical protein
LGEIAKDIANLVFSRKRNNQLRTGYFFYLFFKTLNLVNKKGSAKAEPLSFWGV